MVVSDITAFEKQLAKVKQLNKDRESDIELKKRLYDITQSVKDLNKVGLSDNAKEAIKAWNPFGKLGHLINNLKTKPMKFKKELKQIDQEIEELKNKELLSVGYYTLLGKRKDLIEKKLEKVGIKNDKKIRKLEEYLGLKRISDLPAVNLSIGHVCYGNDCFVCCELPKINTNANKNIGDLSKFNKEIEKTKDITVALLLATYKLQASNCKTIDEFENFIKESHKSIIKNQ